MPGTKADPLRELLAKVRSLDWACDPGLSSLLAEVDAALAAPQPAAPSSRPEPWQNIDTIVDVLEKAGCCRNGYINAPEDVVANTLRDWLRSIQPVAPLGGREEIAAVLYAHHCQRTGRSSPWSDADKAEWMGYADAILARPWSKAPVSDRAAVIEAMALNILLMITATFETGTGDWALTGEILRKLQAAISALAAKGPAT